MGKHHIIVITVMITISTMLYFTENPKQKLEEGILEETILEKRRSKIKTVCDQFNNNMRTEYSSLENRKNPVNSLAGTFFQIDENIHFLCTVLKGGSSSWEVFFSMNKIDRVLLDACQDNQLFIGNCPSKVNIRIVQVRHPLARLLAAYRHVFKNSGWRSLQGKSRLGPEQVAIFSASWQEFVENIVLGDYFNRTEAVMEDYDASGVWIKHHWAPFWYTCGLCSASFEPDLVIKTETLSQDIGPVLGLLGIQNNTSFPHIHIVGTDNQTDTESSEDVVQQYYSQLTKMQVMRLYQMYELDHLLFGYSPQKYIDLAK